MTSWGINAVNFWWNSDSDVLFSVDSVGTSEFIRFCKYKQQTMKSIVLLLLAVLAACVSAQFVQQFEMGEEEALMEEGPWQQQFGAGEEEALEIESNILIFITETILTCNAVGQGVLQERQPPHFRTE
jgi:hypothetical protein